MPLPFITPPAPTSKRRIGNQQSGVVEVEVRGGLTVGESAVIAELQSNEESSFTKGAQIADAIAKAENISLVEAFQLIQDSVVGNQMEPRAQELRVKHSAQIEEVAKVYAAAGERTMRATVTAMIRCRLDQPSWTLEQTSDLPRALFQGLWDLAQDEIAAENNDAAPPTEEALKKPRAGNSKSRPTGKQSSGISATDFPDSGTVVITEESCAVA